MHRAFLYRGLLLVSMPTHRHTKKRGTRLLPFHDLRPSHCLAFEPTTNEAHADYEYNAKARNYPIAHTIRITGCGMHQT